MATGSQLMTTYYAKRIIGDSAASSANKALLQTGGDLTNSMWILNQTSHGTSIPYGIKYEYNSSTGDTIAFVGGVTNDSGTKASINLKTGDITGTWAGNTIAVDKGGTGKTSWTQWGIVYANTSTTLSQVTAGASGNSGYLLQSNGAAAPGWIEATSSKVANTIVKRGNNGGFNAGAIMASLPAGTGDHFIARATGYTNSKNLDVKLMVATGKIYHGIYSTGYSTDGTTFVDNTKWMIYRDNEGTVIVNGNCTGNAATADTSTDAKYIYDWNYGSGAGETIVGALKKFFDAGPDRSRATAVRLKCGSTHMGFGYFLNGANYSTQDTAYGGWFVAAYGTPHYVGISNGTWTDNILIHSNNYTTYCTPANIGAAASDHTHNYAGSASAGGAANSALSQSYQHSTLDFSKSNFDISTAYERNLCWIGDKESRGLSRINFIANTDGTTQIKLQARAWKTADSAVGSFLGITVTGNRDNTVSYTVSNPANFRSAIGAGTGTITGITMNGASKGTSGVIDLGTVLTAHQDISGKANVSGDTFTGYILLKNDDDAPRLHFTSNDTTGQSGGFISINMALTNNIRRPSRFAVRVYSYNSVSGIYDPNNYEQYRLPEVTADRTSYQNYLILTSKEAVTIPQGGTGKTTAAEAWTALGGGASGKHADDYYALASHGTHVTAESVASALEPVFTLTKSNHTGNHGMILDNTTSGSLLKIGYIIGSSGSGGLYDFTHSAWKVKVETDGTTTFTGQVARAGQSVQWVKGRDAAVAKTTTSDGYSPTISVKTTNGTWEIGSYNNSNYADKLIFSYVTDSDYSNNENSHVDYTLTTAGVFSGKAATATALATSGTIITSLSSSSTATYTSGGDITPGVSGTLGVANGGTGANSFTADSIIVSGSTTTSALTTRTIINNTSAGALGWNSTKGTYIPTLNTLAYWNGAYSSTTSNIKYLGALEQHLQIRSAIVKGTAPASATGRQIQVLEASSGTASESRVGQLYIYSDTSKVTHVRLYAFASSTTTSDNSYFGIACNAAATTKRTYTDCKVYGAVWNDYAEFRSGEITEGGYCVHECPDGKLRASVSRLEPGCRVTSDTFGFAIGETKECKTPIAVSGRALVYPYRNPVHYQLGAAVCSAPNGTVDIMSRDEIMKYPERIIGTVSEIPSYDTWYGGDSDTPVEVKGRIWIYVR